MSTTNKASSQESFNMGVLAALHALKTALQASPGFNNEVLVQVIRAFVNNPSAEVDSTFFNMPLTSLLHDHVIDEHGNVRTQEVSLN